MLLLLWVLYEMQNQFFQHLHQSLMFWNDDNSIEMVKNDNRPFEACNNTIDAQLYNKNVGILKLRGFDYNGKPRVEIAVEQSL